MYSSAVFENVLHKCIQDIQEKGISVEECLALNPALRKDLEPLLRLVVRLQRARTIQAPADFRQKAAARMQRLLASSPRSLPARRPVFPALSPLWQNVRASLSTPAGSRLAVAMSIVLIVSLFASMGTAYASSQSLPGDALYPLKTTIEDAQIRLATNQMEATQRHLAFAHRRLDEIVMLRHRQRMAFIPRALRGYTAHVNAVLVSLNEQTTVTSNAQRPLADLVWAGLEQHEQILGALLDDTPADVQQVVRQALALSIEARDVALQVINAQQGEVQPVMPLLPVLTVTATATPELPTATATRAANTATATATSPPVEPSPTPTVAAVPPPPVWPTALPTSPARPTVWPIPPAWPTAWPTPPLTPTAWPTPPAWPTAWPTPPAWPTAWSTPPAWPTAWPTPPAWPTAWPTPPAWPTAWPTPPAWPTAWSKSQPIPTKSP